jgi:hypothetical protein
MRAIFDGAIEAPEAAVVRAGCCLSCVSAIQRLDAAEPFDGCMVKIAVRAHGDKA